MQNNTRDLELRTTRGGGGVCVGGEGEGEGGGRVGGWGGVVWCGVCVGVVGVGSGRREGGRRGGGGWKTGHHFRRVFHNTTS